MLFAQVDAGLPLLQYGALGVLVLVLAWVFLKMLPAKDDLIRDLVKDKDAMAKELLAGRDIAAKEAEAVNQAALGVLRADFKESLKAVIDTGEKTVKVVLDHCDNGTKSLATVIGKDMDTLSKHIDILGKVVERLADKGAAP